MQIIPITVSRAEAFLKKHERHYVEPAEKIAAIAVGAGGELHGAAILGVNQDGEACLAHIYVDGVSQGYTLLYGACWRALKALGYRVAVL